MSAFLKGTILCILAAISFWPCWENSFLHWDDFNHILHNPFIYAPLNWTTLHHIFTQTINGTYIPLTTLSFWVEAHSFGLSSFVVHLDNVLLHLANAFLVLFLARRLGLSEWAAWVSAALFMTHPMHVESIAWATERKDVLFCCFYLLSLIYYIDFLKGKPTSYVLSLLFGFLSILAKPMAISLPWVLFLIEWFITNKRPRFLNKIPFALLILPFGLITVKTLHPDTSFIWPDALLIWIWSCAFYLIKFVWPYPLLPLYIPPEPVALQNSSYLLSFCVMGALGVCLWIFRRQKFWLLAFAFYASTMFFIWRVNFADINIVADRFMYLPSILLLMALAWGVERFKHKTLITSMVVALIALYSVISMQQCRIWHNDQSLWNWVLHHEPKNSLARKKLMMVLHTPSKDHLDYTHFDQSLNPPSASAYNSRGLKLVEDGHWEMALNDFDHAIALNPKLKDAYLNRGGVYHSHGDNRAALKDFDAAIALDPSDATAYLNKAIVYAAMHDQVQALIYFSQALHLEPRNATIFYNRGLLWRSQENYPSAIDDLTKAISIDKTLTDAFYQRGLSLSALGKFKDAQEDFKTVIRLDPAYADAYNELGLAYFKNNQFSLSLDAYTQAIRIDPYNDRYYNNRGLLFLKQQKFSDAMMDYNAAIETNHDPYHNLITRGDLWIVLNNPQKALNDYSQAILWNKTDTLALLKRAKTFFDLGQYKASLKDMSEAIRRDPSDLSAFEVRARIWRQLGEEERAVRDEKHANQNR